MKSKISKASKVFRVSHKFAHFGVMVISFLFTGLAIGVITRNPHKRRNRYLMNTHLHCRWGLKIMNIKVHRLNKPQAKGPFLYVANHYGTTDSFLAAGLLPMRFVTSVENQKTPILGHVMEMAACIFVERRDRANIEDELKNLIEALKSGYSVALYPESKAWNAEEVLPFKRTLMQAAAYAGVPIQPVVVNVRAVNGEDFTLKWRDHVCWWGDMKFLPAIIKTFSVKNIEFEVEFLEPLHPKPEDDRRVVADTARERIVKKFRPVKGA